MFKRAICLVPLVGLFLVLTPGVAAGVNDEAVGRQLLNELNAERAARGVAGLGWDGAVAAASSSWAGQIHREGVLRHSGAPRAEIIGTGARTGQITRAWMSSPPHRRLLLDPNMRVAGVGVSCDGAGRMWAVVQFVKANPAQPAQRWSADQPQVTAGESGLLCGGQEQARAIRRLYLAYFGRDADPAGLQHWLTHLAHGYSWEWISSQFAVSAEFAMRYGALSDEQFVHRAYQNVLGRPADHGGLIHWLEILRRHGRGHVMLGFAQSQELRLRSGLH